MQTIKIVELNNKSRKGTYLYVKEAEKRGSYYRYKTGETFQNAINKYQNKQAKNASDEYAKKAKKAGSIERKIKGGIAYTTIKKAEKAGTDTINQAKRKLFKFLVNDKKILNLIITPHNLEKLKNHLEYRLTAKIGNEIVLTANRHGILPEQALKEITDILDSETGVEGGYKIVEKFREHNWQKVTQHNKNKPTSFELKIIFRKTPT